MESIKLIDEIIIPYVQSQHKELGKPKQVALVIMDAFQGQITDDVFQLIYLFFFIIDFFIIDLSCRLTTVVMITQIPYKMVLKLFIRL